MSVSAIDFSKYETIIKDVCTLLEKKKIKFQSSQSEIMVKDKTKKDMVKLISSLIELNDLPKVLEIVEAKKTVYIRQKVSTK